MASVIWSALTRRRAPPPWLVAVLCLPVGLALAAGVGTEFYRSFVKQVYTGTPDPLGTVGVAALSLGLIGIGAVSVRAALGRPPALSSGRFHRAGMSTAVAGFALMVVASLRGEGTTKDERLTRPIVNSLRVIADAESVFYASHGTYTSDLAALDSLQPSHSRGYSTVAVANADSAGWSANAWSDVITRTCWMSVRRVRGRASKDGPWCTKQWDFKPRSLIPALP